MDHAASPRRHLVTLRLERDLVTHVLDIENWVTRSRIGVRR